MKVYNVAILGAACDVRSHLYWLSFTERPDVSHPLRHGGCRRDLGRARLLWRISTSAYEAVHARHFVSAWGQLNRPSYGGIEGRDRFSGPLFHSARWRHDVPLEGRCVACIGVGPSAAQFIPEVARQAGHLMGMNTEQAARASAEREAMRKQIGSDLTRRLVPRP